VAHATAVELPLDLGIGGAHVGELGIGGDGGTTLADSIEYRPPGSWNDASVCHRRLHAAEIVGSQDVDA
jgi:hypothetical protein